MPVGHMVPFERRRWHGLLPFYTAGLVPLLMVAALSAPCSRAQAIDPIAEPHTMDSQDYAEQLFIDGGGTADGSEEDFDCFAGFLQCRRAWSREKKAWCLERKDVRCPGDEAEESERHKRSRLMGVGMAWMLLGSVAFVMALFYLVHWPDNDIRRYSWSIISTTISIFTAVLLFQAIEELLRLVVPPAHAHPVMWIFVDLFFLLMWFVLLSLTLASVSGANFEGGTVDLSQEVWIVADTMRDDYDTQIAEENVRQPIGKKSVAMIGGLEVFVRKGKLLRERREQKMRCWATLLAHMTGFAAISLGTHMQHFPVFTMNPFMTVVVVLMNQLLFTGLFRIAKEIRKRTEALDGIIDERDKLYEEYTEEAEIDAASLSVSFLATQAMRYWLTGSQPNEKGEEFPEIVHSWGSILSLYGAGLMLGIAAIVVPLVVVPPSASKHDKLRRFVDTLQNQGLMTCAWCIFFATQYWAVRSQVLEPVGGPHSMGGRVVLALGLSLCAFLAIFGLDKIEDTAKASQRDMRSVHRLVKSLVNALGILVGFSWEVSFEGANSAVASLHERRAYIVKVVLAAAVSSVIIPAWRKFVLEKVMLYKRLYEEDRDARHDASWRGNAYQQLEHAET